MLATRCPRCGSPAPVSIATPDAMRCTSCGYAGPPPPETSAALRGAAAVLATHDRSARKLTQAQRRALGTRGWHEALFWAVFALFACPLGCWFLFGLIPTDVDVELSWIFYLLFAAPLGLFAALAFVLHGSIRWTRRRLERACTAAAPAAPGEPALCHVCGAPLRSEPGQPIVDCLHCDADNLVTPEALERMRRVQQPVFDRMETEVGREARSAASAARTAAALILPAALITPPVTLVGVCLIGLFADGFELEPDPSLRYRVWKTDAARCIALVAPKQGGQVQLRFGYSHPAQVPATLTLRAEQVGATLPATAFVGRALYDYERRGTIRRVYRPGTNLRLHKVEMAWDDGSRVATHRELLGLCEDPLTRPPPAASASAPASAPATSAGRDGP